MRRFFTIIALLCMTISAFSQGVVQSGFEAGTKGSDEQNLFMQGDANVDGAVDVVDIQTVAAYILELDAQINFDNADANNDDIINISDIITIKNIITNRQYVDLGLPSGVQWATCNVGATFSEDYGDYFAWGETSPKNSYTSSNSVTTGLRFVDITTNPQYDAARANWGGFWRMPTNAECQELLDECTFEFITQNEVNGYKVTGPNGNYIFMPAAGEYRPYFDEDECKYWSSTPYTSNDRAYYLCIPEANSNYRSRANGMTIRPVITVGVDYPSVTTNNEVSDITYKSAVCGGNVTDAGGGEIIARGVCWSTSPSPIAGVNSTMDSIGLGEYISTLTNLEPNTTYYVRAYVTNAAGISYGEEVTFTTEPTPIVEYEYVDLGLPSGLKWATFNIGAYSPEDYGDYFAWGEIETKETYTKGNSITYGVEMDDISGNPEYDAATAIWGEDWRMPNEIECDELMSECSWEWTTQNGVYGRKVTGPNGNYIFLPAAGYRNGGILYDDGEEGRYWSSTPWYNNDETANQIVFDDYGNPIGNGQNRYRGITIRPVKAEEPEYEYVDLGLPSGLKWAAYNVGAFTPEATGQYFAWGETWHKGSYSINNSETYGLQLDDISGNPEYDAATANWGEDWRMPTQEEFQELVDECTWEWETRDGVNGRKVTGPNGNHIFLPAVGCRVGWSIPGNGTEGDYWSSTPTDTTTNANCLIFNIDGYQVTDDIRSSGRIVRAVKE